MPRTRAKPKAKLSVADLRNWKLLADFQRRLQPILEKTSVSATERDERRQLLSSDYFSLILFGLLNPVLKTMRGLVEASALPRMQTEVCRHPVSLGSFSEMQHLVDPELLAGLLRSLAEEAGPSFGDAKMRAQIGELVANDGTLLPALPRMAWALWQDSRHRAAKLHLELSVWRDVPTEFTVTEGKRCERSVWRQKLRPEVCYVNDRHYAQDYKLIKEVQVVGARHVLRLCNNALSTPLEAPRALSAADLAVGVVADGLVRLGGGADGPTGRLVRVEADGHVFLLFTNLLEAPAETIALIYRYRWRVELFFKWLKCILGCRHWLAESPTGVMVQVYCALIASVLIVLWTGRKPTKRQWEKLQLYWIGWAQVGDLERSFGVKKMA